MYMLPYKQKFLDETLPPPLKNHTLKSHKLLKSIITVWETDFLRLIMISNYNLICVDCLFTVSSCFEHYVGGSLSPYNPK